MAPLLVCAVAASTHFGQRCRFTGMVTLDVCCPQAAGEAGADADASSPEQATVSDPGCCERLIVTVARVPGATGERGLEAPVHSATPLVATPPPTALPAFASARSIRRMSQPPGVAPPAFLLGHSFLI